jgi:hypothetical protein
VSLCDAMGRFHAVFCLLFVSEHVTGH